MTLILHQAALDFRCENDHFVLPTPACLSVCMSACLPACLAPSRQIFPQHKQQLLHSVGKKNKLFMRRILKLHSHGASAYAMSFFFSMLQVVITGGGGCGGCQGVGHLHHLGHSDDKVEGETLINLA